MSRPITLLQLFRLVIGVRWLALAFVPVQEGLVSGAALRREVWLAMAVAAAYTLVLTVFSTRTLDWHLRSRAFMVLDMTLMVLVYASGTGTTWSFFFFSSTTVILAGVRGNAVEGAASGIVFNLLTILAWWLKGVPVQKVLGIQAIEDLFNMTIMGGIFAYGVGGLRRLNDACDELSATRDQLHHANVRLDEREAEIVTLLDIGKAILRRRDLHEVLRIILGVMAALSYGPSRIWIVEGDSLRPVLPEGEPLAEAPLDGPNALAVALRERRTVEVEPDSSMPVPGLAPSKRALVVPILSEQRLLGVLSAESVSGQPFEDYEIEMLELFASNAAFAIEHVTLYRRTEELAAVAERARITEQLEDRLLDRLHGASELAQALCVQTEGSALESRLCRIRTTVREGLDYLRASLLDWDSSGWRDSLSGLMVRYAAEFGELSGMQATSRVIGEERPCGRTFARDTLDVLRTILSNSWRHGAAKNVHVEVEYDALGVALTVRDDGKGFDPAGRGPDGSTGLGGARALARSRNGRLTLRSAPGDGTDVTVWLPL